jgi:hypothetical protein
MHFYGPERAENINLSLDSADGFREFDAWLIARLRAAGAFRDEPVAQASGYHDHPITTWRAAWSGKLARLADNTIRALESHLEQKSES